MTDATAHVPPNTPVPDANLFAETYMPLTPHEATVEANRCLYCFDAPCLQACPTHIDIPTFIRKISTGNLRGSARTILEANFLGGTCARVCPVQELCEGACVLNAEDKPIAIGRLQRYAVDHVQERGVQLFQPGPATGRRVAVVGSGPAGLSAAAELAKLGHAVTLLEKRELGGGLSTYGIIVLREPVEVSLREVEAVRALGVDVQTQRELVGAADLDVLLAEYDAVVLAVGLGAVPAMGMPGEEYVLDGLQLIEDSKVSPDALQVGRRVAVIGAGNTAIDAATIARRHGADVTMVYRRTEAEMTAYRHEYEFALHEGINYQFLTQPVRVVTEGDTVTGLECVRMVLGVPDASGRPSPRPLPGSEFVIPCDQVIKAIGQEKPALAVALGLELDHGYIAVDGGMRTSIPRVYAGGDCVRARGTASTVMAVQDGKYAAAAIHEQLSAPKEAAHG
ncbi:glutamate synthase (NADPH/NADH) small chain [Deinococcus metalli]|uniref:Dihydropyrimidine dehydrogenase subunit A n=1 Tax=Deinococcus metalli TaxID=1141878 RepID=A0A7W8NNL9_9DEIO|nr:NAD(P)-dependent oxidoreductase [Deinococcus metalli]MBB5375906.1 glutamate synthase (NADPH/NADH) small chain [Deinococcus metalli]GHF36166.1 dihydropyrimidine dehydrogenase subunit A [Deinococcus metalli]